MTNLGGEQEAGCRSKRVSGHCSATAQTSGQVGAQGGNYHSAR